MSKLLKHLKRASPDYQSQASLVCESEVTSGAAAVWAGLPRGVRGDAALAPLRRKHEAQTGISSKNGTSSVKGNEFLSDGDEDIHTDSYEEAQPLKSVEFIEMKTIKGDCERNNATTGSGVKKKETKWARAGRYCKISFLLACWAFYTSILMLYSEKEIIDRHSSLAEGEIKSYQISTNTDALRVWLNLNGPFWSELRQKKYNMSETDRQFVVWLEREEMRGGNYSARKSAVVEKSSQWILTLQNDSLIDLSAGESRSTVLEIFNPTPLYKLSPKLYNYSIKMIHNSKRTVPFTVSYTKNPLETKTGILYAAVLLIVLYVIIIFDLINRTLAAMVTSTTSLAVLALVGERPSATTLMSWMDVDTLLLLTSMMLLVALLADTGAFDWLAVKAAERTKGETWPLINMLYLLTIVVSLFLDNVTTVMLLTPATIRLCEVTNLNPIPILMSMVIFCNVGGTATPVGDPPNIIIATNPTVLHAGINFTNFTMHMTVGVFLVFLQTYIQFRFMYRDVTKLRVEDSSEIQKLRQQVTAWKRAGLSLTNKNPDEKLVKNVIKRKLHLLHRKIDHFKKVKTSLPPETFEETLRTLKEKYQLRDKTLLLQTLVAISFIVIVFFLHSLPQIQSLSLGWSALLGTMLLLVLADRQDLQPLLSRLEWSTLLFFAALFIFMEAITKLGLIQWIGGLTEDIILQVDKQYQLPVAILLVVWVSGITSAFVDNIPLTSMMVRVVASLGSNPDLDLPLPPLVWALSFGACMGGNGTLVGASANVITAGIAEQHNYKITFKEFFKMGAPMTIGHLITVSVYLLVAHCVFTWH